MNHPKKAKRLRYPEDAMSTEELAREIVPDGGLWLDLPNMNLRSLTPRQMIGTEDEHFVRELLLGIKYGVFG